MTITDVPAASSSVAAFTGNDTQRPEKDVVLAAYQGLGRPCRDTAQDMAQLGATHSCIQGSQE